MVTTRSRSTRRTPISSARSRRRARRRHAWDRRRLACGPRPRNASARAGRASASCASGDPVITLQWSTSNANNVFFGVDTGTNDAQQSPFFADSLPARGNSTNDFPDGYRPFTYTCGNGSHTYVITAVGSDGSKDSVIVKVTG